MHKPLVHSRPHENELHHQRTHKEHRQYPRRTLRRDGRLYLRLHQANGNEGAGHDGRHRTAQENRHDLREVSAVSKYLATIGRKGGQSGRGKSKARTTEQARKAALARWVKRLSHGAPSQDSNQ